jgi:squalene-hopene/tetraprenyl-beta-curcumene cyclase
MAAPDRATTLSVLSNLFDSQRASGGWAYNERVPADCDSTSWVVLALSTMDAAGSTLERGRAYIRRHKVAKRGFATYSADDRIDHYIARQANGWCAPHPCVTAVAVQALVTAGEPPSSSYVEDSLRYLKERRSRSGLWQSYWWAGRSYCTFQALKAFAVAGRRAGHGKELADTLLTQQKADGSWDHAADIAGPGNVFETAFAALALLLLGEAKTRAPVIKAVAWLVDAQREDGSWSSVPILRIPPPHVRDPATMAHWRRSDMGTGVIIADERRLFTSAAALWALHEFAGGAAESPSGRGGTSG